MRITEESQVGLVPDVGLEASSPKYPLLAEPTELVNEVAGPSLTG